MTTVARGLDNPRDLAFGPDGRLYVAEAGHGGPTCINAGPEGRVCVGLTSAVSRINIHARTSRQVIRGLISTAAPDGTFATGVDGISFRGKRLYGIETGSSATVPPSGLPAWLARAARNQLGRLVLANPWSGDWRAVANVGLRDFVWSSHHKNLAPGQFPDANPYGVLALSGTQWVVDAGSNTIDRVQGDHVSVVRFIPNPPSSDAVPTCIDRGRDGALYIGQLTGGGNAPGAASVWRFDPRSNRLTKWATGLTAVTGCGFGANGRFYAVEFSTLGLDNAAPGTGALVRVPRHSTHPVTVVGGLNFPGGFAAGRDGALYLSNWSIAPAHSSGGVPSGSVVRITLN
ncbi:MAG: ScyD/ScyE family protein [Gaiellales bacterium]